MQGIEKNLAAGVGQRYRPSFGTRIIYALGTTSMYWGDDRDILVTPSLANVPLQNFSDIPAPRPARERK
jgi:hypothetical protein